MWQLSFLALESSASAGQQHITLRGEAFEAHHNPKLFLLEEFGINWRCADDHAAIYRNPDWAA
ncbi:hypothetical protein [Sphingobium sp. YG1]|uniref:hypothetical protein n=1 Tax=Sphingobium sp. YG1 TaxID=2082188 RepID=UPI000DBB7536|nr:hypothetical protein [Sphingobium sp. YG1]BBD01492.1 hypothetical protein YGS_C1P2747 [Sphingobium sp. YG1]